MAQQVQANDVVQIETQPFSCMAGQSGFNVDLNSDLNDFIVVLGASHHMIKNDKYFESPKSLNPPIWIEVAK